MRLGGVRLGLVLCALLAVACGGPRSGAGTDGVGVWYTVAAGDVLSAIAERHGLALDDIIEVNGLDDPDRLEVGQRLFLYGVETVVERARRQREVSHVGVSPAPEAEGLRWPLTAGVVTSGFGARWGRNHRGIDIAAPMGTPVLAAASGTVSFAGDSGGGYGKLVILEHTSSHGRASVTVYAHVDGIRVDAGGAVRQGAPVAEIGMTGRSTGPHLHFEVRVAGEAHDPLELLPAR